MSDEQKSTLQQLAADYLELQCTIAELESSAKMVKDQIQELMPTELKQVEVGGVEISWVKGRRTEKVDSKTVRQELVLAGVGIPIIESAFLKATTTSEGQPHLRISAVKAAN